MGGTIGSIFGKGPVMAGGAPTGTPGVVGVPPTGNTVNPIIDAMDSFKIKHPLLSSLIKGGVKGGADKYNDSLNDSRVGGAGVLPAISPMPVDPGYFTPGQLFSGAKSSPYAGNAIYGG